MKLLTLIFFSSFFLWGQGSIEKLIVSAHKEEVNTQSDLLLLERLFKLDPKFRKIDEKYALDIEIEKLGAFYLLSIQPIDSLAVKNDLLLLLQAQFSGLFFMAMKPFPKINHPKEEKPKEVEKVENFDGLGLQWLVLWSLSVLGLILSVRSRRKLSHLAQTQDDFNQWQKKIENEIQSLKGSDD